MDSIPHNPVSKRNTTKPQVVGAPFFGHTQSSKILPSPSKTLRAWHLIEPLLGFQGDFLRGIKTALGFVSFLFFHLFAFSPPPLLVLKGIYHYWTFFFFAGGLFGNLFDVGNLRIPRSDCLLRSPLRSALRNMQWEPPEETSANTEAGPPTTGFHFLTTPG